MALPPMTLEGIRPFLPRNVNDILAEKYSDRDIPQFFNEQGISIKFPLNEDRNFRMHWKRNEENNVTGIFWRFLSYSSTLAGYNPTEEGYEQILIGENRTELSRSPDFPQGIFLFLKGKRVDHVEIPFNINQIDNIEAIRQFFASKPELLPANLRERVFPQEAQPVAPQPREPINYKLLIGSLLAFAVISYIAIKVLHKPPQAEVK